MTVRMSKQYIVSLFKLSAIGATMLWYGSATAADEGIRKHAPLALHGPAATGVCP